MKAPVRWWAATALLASILLLGCGGGSGGADNPSAPAAAGNNSGLTFSEGSPDGTGATNVQAITVSLSGPTGQFRNMVMTSVTVCVPGTGACQTIPNVQVDTGSCGLRLLA